MSSQKLWLQPWGAKVCTRCSCIVMLARLNFCGITNNGSRCVSLSHQSTLGTLFLSFSYIVQSYKRVLTYLTVPLSFFPAWLLSFSCLFFPKEKRKWSVSWEKGSCGGKLGGLEGEESFFFKCFTKEECTFIILIAQ